MTRTTLFSLLLIAASGLKITIAADGPIVLDVWPEEVVGDFGTFGPERLRAPDNSPTRTAKWITSVTQPTISVFRPPASTNNGLAIVICPGGGYWNLAWDLEGEEVATWLNSIGATGIVLKYRVPRRPGQPEPLPAPLPLLDAQRAVSLVRSHADDWDIDAQRIGIIGFSAGGHLAVTTATYFDRRSYDPIDQIDTISCRPDFAVAVYPGYLVPEDRDTDQLAPYIRIPPQTPPMFFVHTSDDPESGPQHSLAMYLALKRAGVRSEVHIYSEGGHGYGVRSSELPCSTWSERCVDWLRNEGFVRKEAWRPRYTVQHASDAIQIDGRLDEADWKSAPQRG